MKLQVSPLELVLTHNNMDFDSLASQFGVTKLHPSARMILGYPLVGNVRDFLALYRSSLPIAQMKYVDKSKITRLYIVDCQHIERLDDSARRLIDGTERKLPYTIFDHHDPDPHGLGTAAEPDSIIEKVGAATTLIVEKMIAAQVPLTPFEATLLAIGIHEDTGSLTYSGTTEKDALCLAHLLKNGADLAVVNDFIHPKLNDHQTELLQDLVKSCRTIEIHGSRVAIAHTEREKYIDGLASLTRKLVEIESVAAAFTVALMRDRVHIVARSDSRSVDARTIVREFGGDGHPGAASAVVRDGNVSSICARIEQMLQSEVHPQPLAQDVMTSPVRTILPRVAMDEANRIMLRYGLDGLVVAENERVAGVVSRRDIDQAMHHKLGHAPVEGFMSRPVISIAPTTPMSEIQRLMVVEDIGRLPVINGDGHLLGMVSRHDVLKTLYGQKNDSAQFLGQEPSVLHAERVVTNYRERLEQLDPSTLWLSQNVGKFAAELNMVAYAVGGFVRDLILSRPNFDLDYVIEGSAWTLAQAMEQQFPAMLHVVARHDRFQTATLEYARDSITRSVDFSTARTEVYEYPAALPTVEPSKLDQDLIRRDFTINALAICLNPDRFGQLIDEFGGLNDIRDKLIRILHRFSFIEDPTRIMRAVRFAARLGFSLEEQTKEQARHAIEIGIFDDLGGTRIREELRLILESSQRLRALDLLSELGAKLRYLDAELEYTQQIKKSVRTAERLLRRFPLAEEWIVYLGVLVSQLPESRLNAVLERLHLTNEQKTIIGKGLAIARQQPKLFERGRKSDGHGLKNSEIFHVLHGSPDASLAICAAIAAPGTWIRSAIKLYLDKLRWVRPDLTGEDLIRMGFKQGPEIGRVLGLILNGRLDGEVKSREDELALAGPFLDGAWSV